MRKKPSAAAALADMEAVTVGAKAAILVDVLSVANHGGIRSHALFFDALVELIPPRFYLPAADEDRPWYQGLSKAAKAAMKAQSRANIKAARRARLDPSAPSSSTLDLLKKSVSDQAPNEELKESQEKAREELHESEDESSSEEEGDEEDEDEDEGDDDEEMPIAPAAVVSEDRSVTYEELRDRLHRRIAELRGNRCTRPEFLNKPKKEKGKKAKGKKAKKGKEEGRKRKRENDSEDAEEKGEKKLKKEAEEKASDIAYGNVWVDPKEARRKKKRRIKNKKKALEQAKRMQEAKKDPVKGSKVSWNAAVSRAAGEKVHDDPKLIKESMKREKKRQQKHAEQWKERQKTVEKQREEKQRTRMENIRERAHQKKQRKIEKREKKLLRPGFEGRKEGYVNE